MIGKRTAAAFAVALLGIGLTLAPASDSLARCKCGPKRHACKVAHKTPGSFFDCTGLVKAEKRACKARLRAAIKADCGGCVPKTCSSPSGAFLD